MGTLLTAVARGGVVTDAVRLSGETEATVAEPPAAGEAVD
jgi:hypothetical protein